MVENSPPQMRSGTAPLLFFLFFSNLLGGCWEFEAIREGIIPVVRVPVFFKARLLLIRRTLFFSLFKRSHRAFPFSLRRSVLPGDAFFVSGVAP